MKLLRGIIVLLLPIGALIGASIFIASIHNSAVNTRWLSHPSSEGTFIDNGGRKLFCRVKGHGSPAVLIETWGGGPSFEWWRIQDSLARKTTVITYDRGGYGWSEPGPVPRTSDKISGEIAAIAAALRIDTAMVLVGHSIGGLYVIDYCRRHPDKVAGAVLLDAVSLHNRRWWTEFPQFTRYFDKAKYADYGRKFAKSGLERITGFLPYENVPAPVKNLVVEHYCSPRSYDAMQDEIVRIDSCIAIIDRLGPFPAIPLKIIAPSSESIMREWIKYQVPRPVAEKMQKLHEELTKELIRYSPAGTLSIIDQTGHGIHLDRPDALIAEIGSLIEEIRLKRPQNDSAAKSPD
jgi:pimeloyl-ACP methyl ester carboxylesterase